MNEVMDETPIENLILEAGERLNQVVYEKYLAGTLSQEELESVYSRLRQWSKTSEQLLDLLEGK